ncbi:MAG: cation-transporting P-type ATPase, partial [Candidatus Obscuribacterales bacterium]|nr:cation-transporting P-type ATPase [Candidatus Obscuribacterales bacterium]
KMSKSNALIKRLSAVETLGCTTVICTDKTGTITRNQMIVQDIWTLDGSYKVTGTGYDPDGGIFDSINRRLIKSSVSQTSALASSLLVAARCNNAKLLPPTPLKNWSVIGDPTEGALLTAARKFRGSDDGDLYAHKICDIPFDSHRKRMSSVYDMDAGRQVYLKGATAQVLSLCTRVASGGTVRAVENCDFEKIVEANDRFAEQGLRVLALAGRLLPPTVSVSNHQEVEQDLTFYGLIAMFDPPHEGVVEAVSKCHQAGIKMVMITGDYGLTAESIARKVGIVQSQCSIVTGDELDQLAEDELAGRLRGDVIFARILPEQKLRIVEAFQRLGHVVAMTGDGVNDAPALRKADIGIAMGVSGSDVARESADMILADDNFASIVNAIELGRAVYANIRKFATYVLTSNMAEAVPFGVALFSHGLVPLPLTVMQVLSIDLGTDMVPALGLGMEKAEEGIMNVPPRNLNDPLLSYGLLSRALFWYGLIESIAGMSCYFFANFLNGWPVSALAPIGTPAYQHATTMTVAGIVAGQIGTVLCCRTDRSSIFQRGFFENRVILVGIVTEVVLLLLMMYFQPLRDTFNMTPLTAIEWWFAFLWIPAIVAADELRKLAGRVFASRRKQSVQG